MGCEVCVSRDEGGWSGSEWGVRCVSGDEGGWSGSQWGVRCV